MGRRGDGTLNTSALWTPVSSLSEPNDPHSLGSSAPSFFLQHSLLSEPLKFRLTSPTPRAHSFCTQNPVNSMSSSPLPHLCPNTSALIPLPSRALTQRSCLAQSSSRRQYNFHLHHLLYRGPIPHPSCQEQTAPWAPSGPGQHSLLGKAPWVSKRSQAFLQAKIEPLFLIHPFQN